ncbi:MAG TPA: serine/threonine-protein kinase [Phycisphaerales bacterium]|nr:serine/threonine-protein kinase [Phycisphaerales bacterium]
MTPDRFQRASTIFLAARAIAGEARQSLLSHECGDDSGLRREVDRLLAADPTIVAARHGAADGHEAPSIAGVVQRAAAQALRDAQHDEAPLPKRIGRYRILCRLGAGGMGAVYQAEQENPRRIVALKVMRPGLMSRSMMRRFEYEAEVLGRLRHPGIAQIYEAGTDDQGEGAQPYFAMEFVDGQPLTAYADARNLGTRQRLELLALIADAVEHAHRNGVIHRDLKPANILVIDDSHLTTGDSARGDGRTDSQSTIVGRQSTVALPKVLDFGVARAIDSDIQTTTLRTDVGQLIGTVSYMSPEQAAARPEDLDTRSDVYAMGVIAYELLGGRLPHDLRQRSIPEAMRIIATDEPTPLSAVNRVFRGDVETIVGKALEKEKSRRYQSAAEFAADIRRYLRDEPITARPASAWYQARKFARRNKALVTGLAIAFVALTLGVIGTSIGLVRSMEQTRKAQRLNEYLQGMIAFLDPSKTKNNQVTLRDVLDDASRRVDAELADEPEVAAQILVTLSQGYANITEYDLSVEHGHKAIKLMRELFSADDMRLGDAWGLIGQAHFRAGRAPQAEEAYREALTIHQRRLGPADDITLGNIRDIIHAMQIQNKTGDMDELTRQAVDAGPTLPAWSDKEEVGLSLEAIGDILATQHRTAEAEEYYLRAIDVLERVKGSRYAAEQCIVTMRNMAFIHAMQQRFEDAEKFDHRAVEMSIATFGMEDDITLISMQGWSRMLRELGRLEDAERVARDSLRVTRQLYGEDSVELGTDLHNLAVIRRDRGDPEEAIEFFTQALAVRRRTVEPDSPDLSRTLSGLGLALIDVGRAAEAVPLLREALDVRIKAFGATHSSVSICKSSLGAALAKTDKLHDEEAERLLLEGWAVLKGAPPAARASRDSTLQWLIEFYETRGRADEAAKYRALQPATAPATQAS